jgi:hypothetical protein
MIKLNSILFSFFFLLSSFVICADIFDGNEGIYSVPMNSHFSEMLSNKDLTFEDFSDEMREAAKNINYGGNKILSILPKEIIKFGYDIICIGRNIKSNDYCFLFNPLYKVEVNQFDDSFRYIFFGKKFTDKFNRVSTSVKKLYSKKFYFKDEKNLPEAVRKSIVVSGVIFNKNSKTFKSSKTIYDLKLRDFFVTDGKLFN